MDCFPRLIPLRNYLAWGNLQFIRDAREFHNRTEVNEPTPGRRITIRGERLGLARQGRLRQKARSVFEATVPTRIGRDREWCLEVAMCQCSSQSRDTVRPSVRLSVRDRGSEEARRYKWIESEKAGRDLGDSAIRRWVHEHWNGFLRARWLEH